MVSLYRRLNQNWRKLLWWLTVGSLLLTLPIAGDRFRTESTSKIVEFVFDYRDLLEIADTKANPQTYTAEQLKRIKQAGIGSLAVYESTLNELKLARRIEIYDSHEATALTQEPTPPEENFTYVLFTDPSSRQQVQEMLQNTFQQQGVKVRPWTVKNQPGLVLELPADEAVMKPLPPDPIALQSLRQKGFNLVIRIGNRQDYEPAAMDALLKELSSTYKVRTVLFDGDSVPGYSIDSAASTKNLTDLSLKLQQYQIAPALIEPVSLKTPQKGISLVAKELNYGVIRLHSISERDSDKLAELLPKEQLNGRIRDMSDRIALAVKDRNIRLVFLNARASRNADRGVFSDPMEELYQTLTGVNGENGAVKQIEQAGYSIGRAHAFTFKESSLQHLVRPFAFIGAISLIALTLSYFVPGLSLLVSLAGFLGGGALYVLSPLLTEKLLALGGTICAAALGLILAMRYFRRSMELAPAKAAAGKAVLTLVSVTAVSSLGMLLVVALHRAPPFMFQIDQFTGVKMLAYMPILLVALYLVFFSEELSTAGILDKARRLLQAQITVLWIVCVAVIGAVGMYYLSRTGNEGSASSLEMGFRSFLENTLGVRPRTKEFLFAYPALILGAYLVFRRYTAGLYLLLLGAIGQASAIGTFTHLHTPLYISFLRGLLGVGFGIVLGLLAILAWMILEKGWKTWVVLLRRS